MRETKNRVTENKLAVDIEGLSAMLSCGNATAKKIGDDIVKKREPDLLPKISAHILRHTGCTRMAESGMDMKVVQYLMGHAYMNVTMDVYNHITEQSRIETELAKLNSAAV